jgi:asparagine synthase (glutamine-hydrolysing)
MCGIAGIISQFSLEDKLQVYADIARMQYHRGPDNFGYYSFGKRLFFHNRLSILDVSEHANQPIVSGSTVLVYNGEIYNYKELCGLHFPSEEVPKSDTHVLFKLLSNSSVKVLPELNGMFAFAFYHNKQLLLCRDRLGIKPVYCYMDKALFVFASELKTILAFLRELTDYDPRKNLNIDAVEDLWALGHLENQKSPYNSIVELTPGSALVYDEESGDVESICYFELPQAISQTKYNALSKKSEKELIHELDEMINRSVQKHLQSDVKVGTLCSGGVDSSLITAIAVKHQPEINIYHAGVEGKGGEEDYAEHVARHLNIDIKYIKINYECFLNHLPRVIWHNDLPVYHQNDIALFLICEKAKKDKVKVLLAGEGSDELFGGYSWHRVYAQTLQQKSNIAFTGCINNFLLKVFDKFKEALRHRRGNPDTGLGWSPSPLNRFFSRTDFQHFTSSYLNYSAQNVYSFAKKNALLRNREGWEYFHQLTEKYNTIEPQHASELAYISNNLNGHLSTILHRNDRMGMMASIETRVPFLENEIIDFGVNLPLKHKLHKGEGKYLLKKVAEKYIPHRNIYRPKAGFPIPWKLYMNHVDDSIYNKGFVEEALGIKPAILKDWMGKDVNLKFTALSIELWGRIHVLNQPVDHMNIIKS